MDHGTDVVVIVVGHGDTQKEFAVHKRLICGLSTFFNKTFNGAFKESAEQRVELPDENPMVFEAFYEFLYAGKMRSSYRYTKGVIAAAHFWLRLYRMGDRLLMRGSFQGSARDRFNHLFPSDAETVPSTDLIQEIFDEDPPLETFERHLVQHTAYWLDVKSQYLSKSRLDEWKEGLRANERFGTAVAITMIEMRSPLYPGINSHPSESSDGFRIHIELWTGRTVAVIVNLSDMTRDLKVKIPVYSLDQRVWLNDVELRNGRPLFDFAVEPESVLRLGRHETHHRGSLQLFVKKVAGATFDIWVDPLDTIDHVQSEIYGEAGIPVKEQRLFYGGGQFDDARTLDSYGIVNGDTILLDLC